MSLREEIKREVEALEYARVIEQNSEKIAINCIKSGKYTLEEIAYACDLSLQRVEELARTAL